MRMPVMVGLLASLMLTNTGCFFKDIDAREIAMRQKQTDMLQAFTDSERKFANVFRATANQKHALQQIVIDKDFAAFKERHTSKDGRLVSLDKDGKEAPMLVVDMENLMKDRAAQLATLSLSQSETDRVLDAHANALAKVDALNFTVMEESLLNAEAKQKLVAVLNEAISALTGAVSSWGAASIGANNGVNLLAH